MKGQIVEILDNDYRFKVVDVLQPNWALIEPSQFDLSCVVYFIGDTSGYFDQIEFADIAKAGKQL